MDSGNTVGSLQSSDDECNSRAAATTFQQPKSVDSGGYITTHYHLPPQSFNQQNQINNPFFFTPFPHHRRLLNLDSKTLPFSDFPSQPAALTVPFSAMNSTDSVTPTDPPPPLARNPKKRSRASRKAPTTVITTDTTNFRAMVHEVTGIPAPPFTSSSPMIPSLTTSFDIFGKPSASDSAMMRSDINNFDNLPQLPPYLLHPFQQKLQSSPCYSSSFSSFFDSSNLLNTMQNTITFPSNSINQSQNVVSLNGIGNLKTQFHDQEHTTLPVLVSTATAVPTTTTTTTTRRNESSGMKDDQGFVEPWNFLSD